MGSRILVLLALSGVLLFTQCTDLGDSGSIVVHIADVPPVEQDITGIYVTITDVEYRKADGIWQDGALFDDPIQVNLLDLSNGVTALLGEYPALAGNYEAIRFVLEAPVEGQGASDKSYVQFANGSTEPLYLASLSDRTAVATGNFTVPFNGSAEVVADFNTRTALVHTQGENLYVWNPNPRVSESVRLGSLEGTLTEFAPEGSYTVAYAYSKGTFSEAELADVEMPFPNAFSADVVESDEFILASLPIGVYDIYLVSFNSDGKVHRVEGEVQTIVVDAGSVTQVDIDGNNL